MLAPALIAFVAALSTYTLVLGLTGPNSVLRLGMLPLMFAFVYLSSSSSSAPYFNHPLYANILGGSSFSFCLQYLDVVLLSAWAYAPGGPTLARGGQTPNISYSYVTLSAGEPPGKTPDTVLRRLWFASSRIFDTRLSSTPWEVPNTPPFPQSTSGTSPRRSPWILWWLVRAAICFLLLDATKLLAGSPEQNVVLFAEDKVALFTRLGEVTVEDVVLRFISATMFWFATYLFFQGVYCMNAALFVGLGVSAVERYRPLFGGLGEAWLVRRFWGNFWHQALRQTLTSPSRYITCTLLGLRKNGLTGRYLFIGLCFFFSGLLHLFGDLASGLSLSGSGVIRFFTTQTLGIMIEDGIQALWRRLLGDKIGKETALWKKLLGYAWVAAWMAWSVPVYSYPQARNSDGRGVLPFSLVDRFT